MTTTAKMTINGKDADTANHLTVTNPANGDILGTAPDAGMAELDLAIAAARAAYPKWRATPYAERQAVVAKIGEVITANAEELMRSLTLEQGKPAEQAQFEIFGAAAWAGATAMLELPVFVLEDEPGHRIETHHVLAVEFSADALGVEGCPRDPCRQHDGLEALAVHAAHRVAIGRALARGDPRRRAQHHHRRRCAWADDDQS
jgi:Aldehyde dehydrogenase family